MQSNTMSVEPEQNCDDRSAPDTPFREKWAFQFSVTGDLRFISHRDTVRVFQRALARASLPVRYSEGFNPHPRLSLPLPRAVGVASDAEIIVVEFDQPIDGEDALTRLNAQMPAHIHLSSANRVEPGHRFLPELVRYRIEPPSGQVWSAETVSKVAQRIESVMGEEILYIDRETPGGKESRRIDMRSFLIEASMERDGVAFTLRVTPGGTARPREVAALLGFDSESVAFGIRRIAVEWQSQETPGS